VPHYQLVARFCESPFTLTIFKDIRVEVVPDIDRLSEVGTFEAIPGRQRPAPATVVKVCLDGKLLPNLCRYCGTDDTATRYRALAHDGMRASRGQENSEEEQPAPVPHIRLTMRLSDAGFRCRETKLIYPDHRFLLG
jgi:hypothetical protein